MSPRGNPDWGKPVPVGPTLPSESLRRWRSTSGSHPQRMSARRRYAHQKVFSTAKEEGFRRLPSIDARSRQKCTRPCRHAIGSLHLS
jgi:hypothetical protein